MAPNQFAHLTPAGHQRRSYKSPSDVHPDLNESTLREALEYARDSTAVSDNGFLAPTGYGTFMYHHAIAKIRELMAGMGWESQSVRNLPYTISPDGSIKITAATGNESTGIKGGSGPILKEKGNTPSALSGQMTLFDPSQYSIEQYEGEGTLWYVVFFVDRKHQEIRLELSKPFFDENNKVKAWVHRIILDPVSLQNIHVSLPPNEAIPTIEISPINPSETDIAVGY